MVRIPPPLVAAAVGGLMYGLDRLPFGGFDFPGRPLAAACCFALAFLVLGLAVHRFRAAGTTLDPLHPDRATALVESGIFRYSRNPMYLGFALALAGWGLHLANLLGVAAGIPLFVLYIDRFQILPEERALEARFGAAFRTYRSRVRRWI